MKFKLSRESAISWIDSTVDEIKEELDKHRIRYNVNWTKSEGDSTASLFYIRNLTFPWDEGDVSIGTLHIFDDLVISGNLELRYPSIETYHFPWDEGDITVFNTPKEFVRKLNAYYKEKMLKTKGEQNNGN